MHQEIQRVCARTNRIKHEGRWVKFEEFLSSNLNMRFSHGMSEGAAKRMMAEVDATGDTPETDLRERRIAPQNAGSAGWRAAGAGKRKERRQSCRRARSASKPFGRIGN